MDTATRPFAEASAPQAPAPPAPARARRLLVPGLMALAVLAVLAWAVPKWLYGRAHESTDNAQVDGHIIPVLARVSGYVQSVQVAENQHVEEGAVLVQLDTAELVENLAKARADLAAAEAMAGGAGGTGQAQAAVGTAVGQREATAARITAARADEARARADLARFETLAAGQAISEQQLEVARTAALTATATREALERQESAAGASVSSARAGVRLAQAQLDAARAARESAELQLSYAIIRSPASGTVSRRQVEAGQLVQANQPVLAVVADTGLFVTANLKETQLDDVRIGQPVEFDVDAYGGCRAHGTVESISGATGAKFSLLPPENATGNFTKVVQRIPVRVSIAGGCGPERPLRPGMSVNAHIRTR